MKQALKKIFSIALIFMMVFGVIQPITFQVDAATAKYDAKALKKGGLDYGYLVTGKSGVVKGYKGVCADPWQHCASNLTGTLYHIPNDHPMARLAYYYYKKDWSLTNTSASWPSGTSSTRTMRMSHAMSYARVKNDFHTSKTVNNWKSELKSQGVSNTNINYAIKLYNTAMDAIGKNDVPEAFDVYLLYHSGKQDGVVWKMRDTFKADMKKSGTLKWANDIDAYANFANITYELYKSDKSTKVGTFTVKKNGTSNTISGLVVGENYYIKETVTNDYYQKSTSWIGPKTGTKGKTVTFSAVDDEKKTSIKIIKKEENGNPIPDGAQFKFHFVHNDDSSYKYDLTVTGNGSDTASGTLENIPAGKYTITETSMPEEFEDATGSTTVTAKINETVSFTWINQLKTPPTGLRIIKTTTDGGSLSGFKFKVTGVLKNEGTIDKTEILNTVNPSVTFNNPDQYTLGTWTVNSSDMATINNAAKNRETGTYTLRLTNTLTANRASSDSVPKTMSNSKDSEDEEESIDLDKSKESVDENETPDLKLEGYDSEVVDEAEDMGNIELKSEESDEDADIENIKLKSDDSDEDLEESSDTDELITLSADNTIEITVNVTLKDVTYDSENDIYVATYTQPSGKTANGTDYTVSYNDFTWNGAATIYKDVHTGEAFTMLTTKSSGHAYRSGASKEGITEGITYGEFTVTEELTAAQKKKYRTIAPQTKTVTSLDEPVIFNFKNIDNPVPFTVKKVSTDGNVANIGFHLTGTDCTGKEYSLSKKTNASGNMSFGNLYSGSYVLEEVDFDSENFTNPYPLAGYDNPAVSFSVLTDENGNWTATFNDGTTKSGNAGDALSFEFKNVEKVPFYVTKIDEDTGEFLPGATFELYENGTLVARFQILTNNDGSAGIKMLWSNGAITGNLNKTTIDDDDIEIIVDDDDDWEDTGSGDDDIDTGDGDDDPTNPDDIVVTDYNWARLDGLVSGSHYELRETVAPSDDYGLAAPIEFDFEDHAVSVIVKDSNSMPIYIKKASGNTKASDGNPLYSLEGTEFALYENIDDIDDDERFATLRINANGESDVVEVKTNQTYFLVETKAGSGYIIPDALKASNHGYEIYMEKGMENITIR